MTIGAVIPTRYHPPHLDRLLSVCEADNVAVALMESERYDHQIYRMWNAGRLKLELLGCQYIAFLNDDVTILPGTLPHLAFWLSTTPTAGVAYPSPLAGIEPTTGTWGAGGMTGFCFVINNALPLPHFDEGFHWWYGDDAFEEGVRRAGYDVLRVGPLPVEHTPNGSASRDWERLGPLVQQDRARWEARHA